MSRTHSQGNDESCLIIFGEVEKLILCNYGLENFNYCGHHKMNKNLKLVWIKGLVARNPTRLVSSNFDKYSGRYKFLKNNPCLEKNRKKFQMREMSLNRIK